MIEKFTLIKQAQFSILRKNILSLIVLLFLCGHVSGQVTISTASTFVNTETKSTVTFNFQNTNAYPVVITDVAGIVSSYGDISTQLWYKTSGINGAPGDISTTNGWVQASTGTFPGIQNLTSSTTQPFLSGLSLVIPANTTYGIAVVATGSAGGALRIGTATGTFSLNGGGCNIITGNNIGYAAVDAPPAAPTLTPRGWLGKITFIPGSNCTGTPNVPAISGPANICPGALFNLTSSGYSLGPGISYQWQFFNTTSSTWVDIAGANAVSYTASAGIATSTQYRLKTSCSFTTTQSLSNVLTVGIGSGLAGVYTINNNLPSTATNFTSFTAAAAAMSCGITGPVTLNVDPASGPYTEMVTFGNISGTSPVNTIRLNGNGVILQYNSPSNNVSILKLQGTDYMTIDSLTVRSLSVANGYGICLADTATHDSVMHCFVDMSSLTTINAGTTGGIILSDDAFTTTNYGLSSSCFIGYNHILGSNEAGGPYFGIMDGWNNFNNYNNNDTGNVIAYNEVENFTYFGITTSSGNQTKILYNDIHRTNKTSGTNFIGISNWGNYNNNNTTNYTSDVQIVGNRIHNPSNTSTFATFYGIQSYNNNNFNNNNDDQHVLIANNAIYNVNLNSISNIDAYGIIFWAGDAFNTTANTNTTKIYHNTIDFSQAIGGTGEIFGIYGYDYWSSTTTNDDDVFIKNNIVTITNGTSGNKYGFYFYDVNTSSVVDLDAQRNNYYLNSSMPGTQYYAGYLNTNYLTMAAFQAANPTLEVGSLSVNPQYTSAATGDLTPLNYSLYGNGVNVQADVPADILGKLRSTTPTPGAFEIATDAGVTALVSPLGTYCSSVKLVKVSIANSGITTINNVQVNWKLNGVLQTPVNFTGTLLPGNNTVVTLGNGLFMPSTPVEIKAWTSMPNGQPDGLPFNDTLVITTQSSTSVPVNLGPDALICTGNTLTLDAGYPGAVYLWDNNANTQTRIISAAGTYYVRLTALDGCIGVDTFILSLRPLPVVDLGPDREICLGQTTTFDAGHPGATYLWDDGSTMQTRTVDTAGSYEAQVTDIYGCMGVDNVNVGMKDIPKVSGINATHADSGTYTFYPINPQYAISYRWNFGDGSPEVVGYFVQHTYTTVGIYTVTLYLEGECTGLIVDKSRTVDVFSVHGGGSTGIDERDLDGNFALYPNPAIDIITIQNKSAEKMQRLIVYNAIGQTIVTQQADNTKTHQLKLSGLANGIYTLRLETDKGYVIRKFEVLR
ncbi:MAG: PKD domain-containing protein [Taibaiella sp.]|jgi:hypothetical protein